MAGIQSFVFELGFAVGRDTYYKLPIGMKLLYLYFCVFRDQRRFPQIND